MTTENVSESEAVAPTKAVSAKAVDDQLIDELVGRAQAEGLQLTGKGGLLQQLTVMMYPAVPLGGSDPAADRPLGCPCLELSISQAVSLRAAGRASVTS
ncbi:hypothetical protein [Streptomyces sp. TRM68367]|uniref:hypothetical protein n=1 Tax=Streptomyces sp. TRM68367 TaxID=2758415 RepID=UPI0021D39EC3|nr:hypothetical protein [Streptomyces sp. TRM68367]